jgi:hypothetical protein
VPVPARIVSPNKLHFYRRRYQRPDVVHRASGLMRQLSGRSPNHDESSLWFDRESETRTIQLTLRHLIGVRIRIPDGQQPLRVESLQAASRMSQLRKSSSAVSQAQPFETVPLSFGAATRCELVLSAGCSLTILTSNCLNAWRSRRRSLLDLR